VAYLPILYLEIFVIIFCVVDIGVVFWLIKPIYLLYVVIKDLSAALDLRHYLIMAKKQVFY
jgi:hypothetical protein